VVPPAVVVLAARWWESPEAIFRLEAMWRSWEALRLNPATVISDWLRDHADHHLTNPWPTSPDYPNAPTTPPEPPNPPGTKPPKAF